MLANTTGIIKAINENSTDAQGNATAFIEISQSGEFRVKGTIDETSITSISLGQEMIVRSRTDETKFWTGKITEIKTEPKRKTKMICTAWVVLVVLKRQARIHSIFH